MVSWTKVLRIGILTLTSAVLLGVHQSSAEFEVPSLTTANAPKNVELRGVWAYLRGTKFVSTAGYESYAVGINADTKDTDCASLKKEDCNGVFYFYDGRDWKYISNIMDPATNGGVPFSLNAVVGQGDGGEGNPNPMFVVGSKARIGRMWYYTTPGGSFTNSARPLENYNARFVLDTISSLPAGEARSFYTIDAKQKYSDTLLAGGENGLFVKVSGKAQDITTPWTIVSPTLSGRADNHTTLDAGEDIVRIRIMPAGYAYILTTNFNGGSYFDRTSCPTGSVTRLYKTDKTYLQWKKIGAVSNDTCGYDITVGTPAKIDLTGAIHDHIWVATSKGLYHHINDVDDGISAGFAGSAITTTANKTLYTVSSFSERSGTGINLLRNADFSANNSDTLGTGVGALAEQWSYLAEHNDATGTCAPPSDYSIVSTADTAHDVQVWQQRKDGCVPPASFSDKYISGLSQSIPLTTFEGQKFRITGKVTVEFPKISAGPAAPTPQGGLVIGCGGSTESDPTGTYINCSLNNRSQVVTHPAIAIGDTAPAPVVKNIDITLSREDGIFSSIQMGTQRNLNGNAMFLQLTCEASYGAKVTCSNLRVEEVHDPAVNPIDEYTVITGGKDLETNGLFINRTALASDTFSQDEALPSAVHTDFLSGKVDALHALYALSGQHVYGVGAGVLSSKTDGVFIMNRTPSTLKGFIWAGASAPSDTVGGKTPVGAISVSCVDDRGVNNGFTKSLCQRSPDSYGLYLNLTRTATSASGTLQGRAWFGHPQTSSGSFQVANDQESLNLGACLRKPGTVQNSSLPYDLTGMCDTSKRLCRTTANGGTYTTNSCITDFDCYGRCQRDEGFLCVSDADCSVTGTTGNITSATGVLGAAPASRLRCNTSNNNTYFSPQACSSFGWLSFNTSDFSTAQLAPPGVACVSNKCDDGTNRSCTVATVGKDCFGVVYNTLAKTHNPQFILQTGAHELAGWGRFISLSIDPKSASAQGSGWIRLRGDAATPAPISVKTTDGTANPNTLFACRNCGGTVSAGNLSCAFCTDSSGHSCTPPDSSTPNNPACYYVCEGSMDGNGVMTKCTPGNNNDCSAAAGTKTCKAPGVCSNNNAIICTGDADCGAGNTCGNFGALCKSSGASCTQYGVNIDTESGQFYGSAWSQDFGYLNFSEVGSGGNPSLQTKLGDIYATGSIGSANTSTALGLQNCAATYVISSTSSITNFCSYTGLVNPSSAPISLIRPENTYSNILGRFDLKGIETVVGSGKNKYGTTVVNFAPTSGTDITTSWQNQLTAGAGGKLLDGKVYIVGDGTSTYQLGATTLVNGASPDKNGAGILIVNGNLTITGNLDYLNTSITELRQLASLMVVVRGDLIINNDVSKVVGGYYVSGTTRTVSELNTNNTTPLVFNGLMISKNFEFGRRSAGTIENPKPSELMIYDGRIQTNALPGMTDFSSALPNTAKITP